MISSEHKTRSCFGRSIILIGVVTSLCFSVGEGLRLRPFPISPFTESQATNAQSYSTPSFETSPSKYGPLDVPTRVQKRGKRQVAADYSNPPSQSSRVLTSVRNFPPDTDHAAAIISSFYGSCSSGRAPPLNSWS